MSLSSISIEIVPLYAGILSIIYLTLTGIIISQRRSKRIGIGSGKDHQLQRSIRAHSNFIEYVPFSLILLTYLEINQVNYFTLHLLGFGLVIGRYLHAMGLSKNAGQTKGRFIGSALTFLVIIVSGIWSIINKFL